MSKKRFGIVSDEVVKDPGLSLRAKGLYALLSSYANKERVCFPSVITLSELSGVSRRTIERTLNELQEKKYISRRDGKFYLA